MKEIMVIEGIVLEEIPEDSYNAFFWYSLSSSLAAMILGLGAALFVSGIAFLYPLLSFLLAVLAGMLFLNFPNLIANIGQKWIREGFFFFGTWSIRFFRRWFLFYA